MFIITAPTVRIVLEHTFIVIYDLFYKQVYLVNDVDKIDTLKRVINGTQYEVLDRKDQDFIDDLIEKNLFIFSDDKNIFKDKFDIGGSHVRFLSDISRNYMLNEVMIEIGNTCNEKCIDCNDMCQMNCLRCFKYDNVNNLNVSEIIQIIKNVIYFGCQNIKFVGGDPLIEIEKIIRIINNVMIEKSNVVFTISTNGLELSNNDKLLEYIKKYNINLEIHIIKQDDRYQRLIKKLLEEKIAFYIVFKEKEYLEKINKDLLSNIGLIYNPTLLKIIKENKPLIDKNNFMLIPNLTEESDGKFVNNCMYKKMFIDNLGNCFTCLGSKKIAGNILKNTYGDIYINLEKEWFDISKNTDKCINCKGRNYCFSCIQCKSIFSEITEYCNLDITVI